MALNVRKLRWSPDEPEPVLAAEYRAELVAEDAYGLWLAAPLDGTFHLPDGTVDTVAGPNLQLFPLDQWWTAWWWAGENPQITVDICPPAVRDGNDLVWVDMALSVDLDADDEVHVAEGALEAITATSVIPAEDVNAAINSNIMITKRLRIGDPLFTVVGLRKLATL